MLKLFADVSVVALFALNLYLKAKKIYVKNFY